MGIHTVLDRLIQQALLQVLQPEWDKTFSDHSYGFRPGRSAHQAIAQAQQYLEEGCDWVVDLDLEKFFDRVNQDKLMSLVKGRIADRRVLQLIDRYLKAGVLTGDDFEATVAGMPQEGPLSPLLANLVLHHLDWRLEGLDYRFVRYAADFVVLCTTTRQAEKALEAVTRWVEDDLGLPLNPEKTPGTTLGQGCDYLGYHVTARTIRMGGKAEERCKMKIKALTKRRHNLDADVVMQVNRVVRGTVRSFATAFTTCLGQFNALDRWIRMRLRCMK